MNIKGWRTILLNAAVGAIALTDWLTGSGLLQGLISDPEDAALAITILSAVNIFLRRITTTPVGQKLAGGPGEPR